MYLPDVVRKVSYSTVRAPALVRVESAGLSDRAHVRLEVERSGIWGLPHQRLEFGRFEGG